MKKKKRGSKVWMHILSVFFILFVLMELQIMINYPDRFLWFVCIGALILIDVFFLVSLMVNQKNAAQAGKEEQFESISKSEKASYLLLKKCFQDLDQRMHRLESEMQPIERAMAENGMRVQEGINQSVMDNKKVAKILLGRTRENAEAMISSNDELRRMLMSFDQKLSEMEGKVALMEPPSGESSLNPAQYNEILSSIQKLESSFQKQMEQLSRNAQAMMSAAEAAQPVAEADMSDSFDELEPGGAEEPFFEEPSLEPDGVEDLFFEEPSLELGGAEEPFFEEPLLEPGSLPKPGEAEDLFFEEPSLEPGGAEDLFYEEPLLEPDPLPEPSHPDGRTGTDDIASLLAGVGSDEPKPKMPELGDPNKVMSPEEIAALISNM